MKKLKFLFFPTILALAFGLMLSCSDKDESSSGSSSSSAVTVSGKVQKGPYVQGTEITVRELDSSMTPTGNTFTGTIDDNTGSFSIKGTLSNKIAELAADGYYFNEVSGSLSTAKLALQAFSDLTDSSSVNVNLMTHLEKKRVEYLMDNSKLTFAAAKTQAQTEIMKIFNIDNVTLGNSETLDISKSGDGNAVLLAISAILQNDKTESELTELLSTINTDIRTDGTLDSTTTKATLLTAVDYLKTRQSTIRSNIESRYSNLGISATIPTFESYAFKLDTTAPIVGTSTDNGTVNTTSPADADTFISPSSTISATFSDVMDTTTITTNTSNTTCSGSLQVSSDNFSTCVQMSSSPSASNSDKTFTVTPSSSFSNSTSYKIRVTTGVKDIAGNNLESNYTSSTGFETVSLISHWGDNGSTTGYHSPDSLACDNMATGSGKTCPANGTQYIGQAFQLSSTKSIKYIGLGLCAVGLNSCTDSYFPYSISIYNDNSSKPGSVLNSYTSFLKDDSNFTTMYDENNTAYGVDYSCVIDFGSTKKEFSANTKYWIVAYFSNSAWCPNLSEEATPKVSTMMQSSDGATWSVLDNLTSSNFGSTKHRAIRLWLAE